jgi:hypothetical protein
MIRKFKCNCCFKALGNIGSEAAKRIILDRINDKNLKIKNLMRKRLF